MGKMATVFGIAMSVLAAYVAAKFNNIMDLLQLVFAFVNAPLFATFLLGMFWRRATGHGAFFGLLMGTGAAALHHGLTAPAGSTTLIKGGWLGEVLHSYPSEMAQNFWTAIFAWTVCFLVTIAASLATRQNRTDSELAGLVYSLTAKPSERDLHAYQRPVVLGVLVLVLTLALNIVFCEHRLQLWMSQFRFGLWLALDPSFKNPQFETKEDCFGARHKASNRIHVR